MAASTRLPPRPASRPSRSNPKSFDVSKLVDGQTDRIADWLSGAVKIPTESYDVMGPVGEDPRWDVFYKFADCELVDCVTGPSLTPERPGGGIPQRVSSRVRKRLSATQAERAQSQAYDPHASHDSRPCLRMAGF